MRKGSAEIMEVLVEAAARVAAIRVVAGEEMVATVVDAWEGDGTGEAVRAMAGTAEAAMASGGAKTGVVGASKGVGVTEGVALGVDVKEEAAARVV